MSEKPAFDPERFFELARRVGHGKALGLEYRGSGDSWMELCLPWREELVGVPVDMVSTGPDREETIVLRHPFV